LRGDFNTRAHCAANAEAMNVCAGQLSMCCLHTDA
jgi:hypothetical protein